MISNTFLLETTFDFKIDFIRPVSFLFIYAEVYYISTSLPESFTLLLFTPPHAPKSSKGLTYRSNSLVPESTVNTQFVIRALLQRHAYLKSFVELRSLLKHITGGKKLAK